MLVLNLPAFENKNYTAYDRFQGKSPYGEIPIKREPIRTLGFTSRLPCHIINLVTAHLVIGNFVIEDRVIGDLVI